MLRPSHQIVLFVGLLCCGSLLASASAGESVTFHQRPTQVGDVSRQSIRCDLDLEMSIRQSGQVVQSQRQALLRSQARQLSILSVGAAAPTEAEVRYDNFLVSVRGQDPAAGEQSAPQPVNGKTYRVRRDVAGLKIRYADGSEPPAEELALVTANMESFGLPNPIAGFFSGRTVEVGQTIELPTEVARELLGFTDSVGNVTKMKLKLAGLQQSPGQPRLATFELTLVADQGDESDVSIHLNGKMVFEVDTCRTVQVQLTGPVRASETYGPAEGQFQVQSEGTIVVAVNADYEQRR